MTLLLIRHGETALNAARVLQPADTPLNARGLAQAAAVAERLRSAGLRGIVSSDLPRARKTAEAIARAAGLDLPPADREDDAGLAALLHERNFGDLRGLPHDSLPGRPLEMAEAPPGGESLADFQARVAAAFALVVARRASMDGPLAVVTHGLVIAEMLRAHAAWPDALGDGTGAQRPSRLRNTSVSIIAGVAPHTALRIDCIDHLSPALRAAGDSLTGG